MLVTLNVPTPLVGELPPTLDAPWLGSGCAPLGTAPLGATVTVDASLLQMLLDMGFTLTSETE